MAIQIVFPTSSPTLTSHTGITSLPGTEIQGCIKSVSSTSQQVWPEDGRSTIGGIRFDVLDVTDDGVNLTSELREQFNDYGSGARDKEVRVYIGFDDDFATWQRVATAYVDGVAFRDGVYKITCRDKNKFLRDKIFEKKVGQIAGPVDADDTTITVRSTAGFEMVQHGASFLDAPGQKVGYFKIKDTEEIVRYTGKTSTTFTGCTRGALRTKADVVEWDVTEPATDWPEIEEYVYIELPGPLMAIALMTGVLDVDLGTGGPMLPAHWNMGLSWTDDFDQGMWLNIGADLWSKSDLTKGFPVRFAGMDEEDGKAFIEKEVFQLLGVYAPISIFGKFGLRRVNKVLGQSGYIWKLDRTNIATHGDLSYDHKAVRNQFQVDYNWNGKIFRNSMLVVDQSSISAHGLADKTTLSFKGLTTERHTQRAIQDRVDTLRNRYAEPPLRLPVKCTPDLNWLEIGDIVLVELPTVEDHAASAGPGLSRTFEIQKVTLDWITGEVSFELLASGRQRESEGAGGTGPVLADSWYARGVNIATLPGYVAASGGDPARLTSNLTWAGTADVNAVGSCWYHNGDLRIESAITITGNVQLRVRGFLIINGSINGAGGGFNGATDAATVGSTSTAWSKVGTPGWLGPTRGGDGVWRFAGAGDRDLTSNILGGLTEALNRQYVAPPLVLEVDAAGALVSTLPPDLRGCSGGTGGQVIEIGFASLPNPGVGGTVRAKGGNGGKSGAGLAIICRGLTFGLSGFIDLSGTDGSAGQRGPDYWDLTKTDDGQATDYPVEAGGGAGGYPGALYILLDGDDVPYPPLSSTEVRLKIGLTPRTAYSAVDVAGPSSPYYRAIPVQRWQADLPDRGVDVSPVPYLTGLNQSVMPNANVWNSASFVQYIPAGSSKDAPVTLPPVSLVAAGGLGVVLLAWGERSTWDRVEVFASETNDRAFAEEVGRSATGRFTHHLPDGGLRYYWIRAVKDGVASAWYPSSATAGIQATAQDSGIDVVITANPTRIWNGDASLTPIAWNPTTTTTDLHCQIVQFGNVIAHEIVRVTLDPLTGMLTYAVTLDDSDISVAVSTAPANTLNFRFTHIPTGLYADDDVVAVMSGLPGEPGTPGAPGNRVVGVLKNKASLTGPATGFLFVHGFDALGNPSIDDAYIPFNGALILVEAGTIETTQPVTEGGWIVLDTAYSTSFLHAGTLNYMAGARKTREGWRYDNGAGWSTFTATATMIVIGTYERSASEVTTATIFGHGYSLASLPVEAAVEVRPGDIQTGAINDLSAFASTLRPVSVIGSLPSLPSTNYPEGALVYLTSDNKVYRNVGGLWTRAVDGADIVAGTITAAALAADIVLASLIRTATSGVRVELSGVLGDPYPFWIGDLAKGTVSGSPGSGALLWFDAVAKVLGIKGTLIAAKIRADASNALAVETSSGYQAAVNSFLPTWGRLIALAGSAMQTICTTPSLYHPGNPSGPAAQRLQAVDQPIVLAGSVFVKPGSASGTVDAINASYKLQYSYDGGAWTDVPLSTDNRIVWAESTSRMTSELMTFAYTFKAKPTGWSSTLAFRVQGSESGGLQAAIFQVQANLSVSNLGSQGVTATLLV